MPCNVYCLILVYLLVFHRILDLETGQDVYPALYFSYYTYFNILSLNPSFLFISTGFQQKNGFQLSPALKAKKIMA